MDKSFVGCSRNLTLKAALGLVQNSVAAVKLQPQSLHKYEAGAFDDAVELPEREETRPGQQRSEAAVFPLAQSVNNAGRVAQNAAFSIHEAAMKALQANYASLSKHHGENIELDKMCGDGSSRTFQGVSVVPTPRYAADGKMSETRNLPRRNSELDEYCLYLSSGARSVVPHDAGVSFENFQHQTQPDLSGNQNASTPYGFQNYSDSGITITRNGVQVNSQSYLCSSVSQSNLDVTRQQSSMDVQQNSNHPYSGRWDGSLSDPAEIRNCDQNKYQGDYSHSSKDRQTSVSARTRLSSDLNKEFRSSNLQRSLLMDNSKGSDTQSFTECDDKNQFGSSFPGVEKDCSVVASTDKVHVFPGVDKDCSVVASTDNVHVFPGVEKDCSVVASTDNVHVFPGVEKDCSVVASTDKVHVFGQNQHSSGRDNLNRASFMCRNCGKEGHLARDCPFDTCRKLTNDHVGRQGNECRRCGKQGHLMKDCETILCRRCGIEGHIGRDCPENECNRCLKKGHLSVECHNDVECRFCYKAGHLARDCPVKQSSDGYYRGSEDGNGSKEIVCWKCQQTGHRERNCPSLNNGIQSNAAAVKLYFPPPPPEDEEYIFETLLMGINFHKYSAMPVECTGRDAPTSCIKSFFDGELCDLIQNNIRKTKYDEPTPVQKWSIPVILSGRDLMACALTGSGKTAAYLLPLLTKIICGGSVVYGAETQTPEAIILSPTRELATQIFHEVCKFSHNTNVRSAVVYGGVARSYIQKQLSRGVHLVVSTPGKLQELLRNKWISFRNVKYFVLDEADRLLDLGFMTDIHAIFNNFDMPDRSHRQTMMFSATFPDKTQILAADLLHDYVFIAVGSVGGASQDIEQVICKVGVADKRQLLGNILRQSEGERTLIFVEMKSNAAVIAEYLTQAGFAVASIHSDLSQKLREEALTAFRRGEINTVVATSVAARGLDIPKVMHVINYNMPVTMEEYIHRIGRTGRCGNTGKATSFFDPATDAFLTRALVRVLVNSHQIVPEWLEEMAVYATDDGAKSERSRRRGQTRDRRDRGNISVQSRKNTPTDTHSSAPVDKFSKSFNTGNAWNN